MRKPWHRRSKEPNVWYDRFVNNYLTIPATRRSIDAAFRSAQPPTSKAKQASGAWYRTAKAWSWIQRAEAYDADQRQKLLAAYEEERLEDRRRRLDVMKAARAKLVQALKSLDPSAAGWGQVVHGMVAVNSELRKEYNDEPDGRMQDMTPSRATAADLDDLTDEQLDLIEKAARLLEGKDE